jgi:hypothetical protein
MKNMNAIRVLALVDRIVDEIERAVCPSAGAALADRHVQDSVVELCCQAMHLTFADIAPVKRMARLALDRRRAA